MWRFFGVLLLSCIVDSKFFVPDFDPCPHDSVCLIFVKGKCRVNGVKTEDEHVALVLEQNINVCDVHTQELIWARLDFNLKSDDKWSVLLTTVHDPEDIEFAFAKAELKFPSRTSAELVWDEENDGRAVLPMTFIRKIDLDNLDPLDIFPDLNAPLFEYRFDLTTNGEKKLITLLAGEVIYKRVRNLAKHKYTDITSIKMTEKHFVDMLDEKTPCDFNEINDAIKTTCKKECDPITEVNRTAHCDTKLWFYKTAQDKLRRQWKEINDLKCHLGVWEGNVEGGKQIIDASYSVLCDKKMPQKMTGQLKAIIGFSVGGGILVLLLLIGLFIYCYRNKNANANNKDTFRGGSNSKAGTPSKRWDLSNSKAGTPV